MILHGLTLANRKDLAIAPSVISLAYAIGTLGLKPDDIGGNIQQGVTKGQSIRSRLYQAITAHRKPQDPLQRFIELTDSGGQPLYNQDREQLDLERVQFPVYCRTVEDSFWSYDIDRTAFTGYKIYPLIATYSDTKEQAPFGYLAVSASNMLLAFKGSQGAVDSAQGVLSGLAGKGPNDWNQNTCLKPQALTSIKTKSEARAARVHTGFSQLYESMHEQICQIMKHTQARGKNLTIMGHSLGAGVACMATLRLASTYSSLKIRLCTFGAPPIGNITAWALLRNLKDQGHSILHFGSRKDPIIHPTGKKQTIYRGEIYSSFADMNYIDPDFAQLSRSIQQSFAADSVDISHYFSYIYYGICMSLPVPIKGSLRFHHQIHHLQSNPQESGILDFVPLSHARNSAITLSGKCLIPPNHFATLQHSIVQDDNIQKPAISFPIYDYHQVCLALISDILKNHQYENIKQYLTTHCLYLEPTHDHFLQAILHNQLEYSLEQIFLTALSLYHEPNTKKSVKKYLTYFQKGDLYDKVTQAIKKLNQTKVIPQTLIKSLMSLNPENKAGL
jgi:pimeloyl-ACP methyl ester carboxylesterase